MGISLEKAIEASVKGYIDDPDEISGIFTKLINMKADDFHCNLKDNLLEWNKILMEGYNVEVDRNKHKVTYAETLCLTDNIRYEEDLNECSDEEREMYVTRFTSNIRHLLKSASYSVRTVQLFMAITVKGYFDHLAEKMGYSGKGLSNLYRIFRVDLRRATGIVLDETTKIGTFFKELESLHSKAWIPDVPIGDYEKGMRDSYAILHDFMIGYFKEAYPECFDIDSIVEKYQPYVEHTAEIYEINNDFEYIA